MRPARPPEERPMSEAVIATPALGRRLTEDWLAAWAGLLVFALALLGLAGPDLLGWVVTTSFWTDATAALPPVSMAYASLGGPGAVLATYAALLIGLGT